MTIVKLDMGEIHIVPDPEITRVNTSILYRPEAAAFFYPKISIEESAGRVQESMPFLNFLVDTAPAVLNEQTAEAYIERLNTRLKPENVIIVMADTKDKQEYIVYQKDGETQRVKNTLNGVPGAFTFQDYTVYDNTDDPTAEQFSYIADKIADEPTFILIDKNMIRMDLPVNIGHEYGHEIERRRVRSIKDIIHIERLAAPLTENVSSTCGFIVSNLMTKSTHNPYYIETGIEQKAIYNLTLFGTPLQQAA